jgi:hypothetical protein
LIVLSTLLELKYLPSRENTTDLTISLYPWSVVASVENRLGGGWREERRVPSPQFSINIQISQAIQINLYNLSQYLENFGIY